MNRTSCLAGVVVVATLAGAAGCFRRMAGRQDHLYKWPSVTLTDFQTGELGEPLARLRPGAGLRDRLAHHLTRRGRFTLIDRSPVLDGKGARAGHRARYRIRGVLRGFDHQPLTLPWYKRRFSAPAESELAVVDVQVMVDDLGTKEVVLDQEFRAEATAWPGARQSAYTDLTFDSPGFRRTPLGRCVENVLIQVAEALEARLLFEPWVPEIVRVEPDHLVINGGFDRLMRQGWMYDILEGDADRSADKQDRVVGVVQLVVLYDDHALARRVQGGPFRVGMRLRRNIEIEQTEK